MNVAETNAVLNRLSVIHSRSLAMYLSYAVPWVAGANGEASQRLGLIAEDQRRTADQLGEMILENGGVVDPGEFPMRFTSMNDLSFDFLLQQLVDRQQRDVAAIESCVQRLEGDPAAKAVAQEALGAAKAHLVTLRELKQKR